MFSSSWFRPVKRDHVVKSQLFGAERCVAVLAGVLVACINIGPRELNDPTFLTFTYSGVANGGKFHRKGDTVNFFRNTPQSLNLAGEQQGDGALPTDGF